MKNSKRTLPRLQKGRMGWRALGGVSLLAGLAYLAFWPTGVSPQAWQAPPEVGYVGPHAPNQRLAGLTQWPLAHGQDGPEHITAHQGAIYTGLSNGDILKASTDGRSRSVVFNTGGRPLGIDFDAQGRMLVADAFKGLLRVTGEGAQAQSEALLTQVQDPIPNDPVRYADAVKVGPDGTIWLTDASRRFSAQALNSTFEASVLDILEHSCTGRVIAIEPQASKNRVALSGLCFPNGLAFSSDGKFMFLSETGLFRILKVDLAKLATAYSNQGAVGVPTVENALAQGAATVLIDSLPGYPDNLMRGEGGRLWVGLTKPRTHLVSMLSPQPFLRSVVLRLPRMLWPIPKPYGHVFAFDENGKVLEDLQDPNGAYPDTTAATEADGKLFIQSLHAHAIGWMPYPAR